MLLCFSLNQDILYEVVEVFFFLPFSIYSVVIFYLPSKHVKLKFVKEFSNMLNNEETYKLLYPRRQRDLRRPILKVKSIHFN